MGVTSEYARLEFDMAGFWSNAGNLGPASSGLGFTPSPLVSGGSYRLVFTDANDVVVGLYPSMSFTYAGGPPPVSYSFSLMLGQTPNNDGTTNLSWSGSNLPMMQEVRLVKVIGPSMYDSINGISLTFTPTESGVISNSAVNNYDSYALQTFMGPTSTATSLPFTIPSGTGI